MSDSKMFISVFVQLFICSNVVFSCRAASLSRPDGQSPTAPKAHWMNRSDMCRLVFDVESPHKVYPKQQPIVHSPYKEPEITSIQTEQTELNSHPIKPELSQGDQLVKHEQANSSPQQPTTWETFFLGDQLVKHEQANSSPQQPTIRETFSVGDQLVKHEQANSSPQHPTIHETFSLGDQLVKHEKANSSPQQPTTWETFFLGDPQANSSPQQPTIQETFSPGDQLVKHEKANSSPQQPSIGETFPQGKQLKSERLNSNPANRTFKNSPRQNMGNDSNICRFFRENSYCWNPACTKLHKLDRNNIHPPSNKNFSQRYPLIPPAQWYNDASTCTTFAANGFCWDPSCKKIHPRSSGH